VQQLCTADEGFDNAETGHRRAPRYSSRSRTSRGTRPRTLDLLLVLSTRRDVSGACAWARTFLIARTKTVRLLTG